MISKKLIELSKCYLSADRTKDELVAFCNQYDVIFSNFTDEIERECEKDTFAVLDKIFMLCDSYEPNEEIRQDEPYCIGEDELQRKVLLALGEINAV